MSSKDQLWTSKRAWVLTLLTSLVGGALAWLNGATWWGWILVAAAVVLAGFTAALARHRNWAIQTVTWAIAMSVVAAGALIGGPVAGTRTLNGPHTDPVATAEGDVIGVRNDAAGVDAFAGVPYAAPPVGPLRWEPPAPALHRSDALVADDFGPSSFQPEPSFLTRAATRLMDVPLEETLLGGYASDEDSLRLNIWRPTGDSSSGPRPVLVFVHGGSFTGGSGALPLYDGTALASRGDIVVVTLNYRLGVFGFLAADALGGAMTGNQGLLDQLAALRWLHDNIGAFGGDPGRVTVAGESAGSGSACILGASRLAAGLVHGIIGESGGCLGSAGDREAGDLYDDAPTARDAARALSESLGGATLEQMRAMPAERIAAAAKDLTVHWWPTIDGLVLPDTPTAIYGSGQQNDVPPLLGSNADETSLGLIAGLDSDPATYEREVRETYGADADMFSQLYPGGDADSVGNLGTDGTPDSAEADLRLESEMSRYWIAFVGQHDPNTTGLRH